MSNYEPLVEEIAEELLVYDPTALLLHGGMLRYLNGEQQHSPTDIDIIFIGDAKPPVPRSTFPVDIHRTTPRRTIATANSLRYAPNLVTVASLHVKSSLRLHCVDFIVGCMLYGKHYNAIGLLQQEIAWHPDPRDYSKHRVLHGEEWWKNVCAYAQDRRGVTKYLPDLLHGKSGFPLRVDS